jgi:hypothetical protein
MKIVISVFAPSPVHLQHLVMLLPKTKSGCMNQSMIDDCLGRGQVLTKIISVVAENLLRTLAR